VSAHPPERDWAVVAPWWSWADPARTQTGRATHPVFQKYQTSDPVSAFLENPQHSLRFVDDDVVPQYRRRYLPLRQASPGAGRLRVLASRDALAVDPSDGKLKSFVDQRVPRDDGLRKIFLETHQRFYLVVCEVHCDAPGFPRAAREKICQAGFVVRRRTTEAPAPALKDVKGLLRGVTRRRAQLDKIDAALPAVQAAASAREAVAGVRAGAVVDSAQLDAMVRQRAFVADLLQVERERVAAWAKRFQVAPTLQGFFETPGLDGVGEWRLVEEAPQDLAGESTFPLYPLIPPDDQPDHPGHFGTVYFGLLPGHLADHDAHGRARFKEQEFYEVRCFVQRHLEPHDPDDPCRCPDRLFFSPPTEAYWLAGPYDLVGTSQRPVTIALPDLKDLAADPRPRTGATFSKPPGSLTFDVGSDQKPTNTGTTAGFQICTLPIPLIAIVAMFLLELFLPVVVFIFGLFWMLLLKFCIPPEIDVGAGLTAELAAQAPSLGVTLDASGAIDVGLSSDAAEDALQLSEGWRASPGAPVPIATWSADLVQTEHPAPSQLGADLQASYSAGAVVNWQKGYRDASTSNVPDLTADLQFVVEKEHP
jgi:hypothetical protein